VGRNDKDVAWIESHTLLIHHRKIRELARLLRIRHAYALGHLHALWHVVLNQAEDGDISSWSDELIAEYSDFSGNAPQYVQLLHRLRLIDGSIDEPRRLVVHDWLDYAGTFLRSKYAKKDRERLVRIWAKHGLVYGEKGRSPPEDGPTEIQPKSNTKEVGQVGLGVGENGSSESVPKEDLGGGLGEGKNGCAGPGYATPAIRAAAQKLVKAYQAATATAHDPRGAENAVIHLLMTGAASEFQLAAAVEAFGKHARKTFRDPTKRLAARNFFGGDAPAWSSWVEGSPIHEGAAARENAAARIARQQEERKRLTYAKDPRPIAEVLAERLKSKTA
jgi:hypothetical protein